MNVIEPLLPASSVLIDLDVSSKKRLLEQVGNLFAQSQQVSASVVFDSLFAREKLGSTGLGHGIAIPHGRIKGLKDAAGALIRVKTPIDFDAPDNRPVSLLFVLLVPTQATDLHLQILGELAQMFSDKAMRQSMMEAGDAATLHRLVCEWKP